MADGKCRGKGSDGFTSSDPAHGSRDRVKVSLHRAIVPYVWIAQPDSLPSSGHPAGPLAAHASSYLFREEYPATTPDFMGRISVLLVDADCTGHK